MQVIFRGRAVIALVALLPVALPGCLSGLAEEDPETCPHDSFPCVPGPMCNGHVAGYCEIVDHGCHAFGASLDCHQVGAQCQLDRCVWPDACPPGTDALCRNGHVLECENGAFVGAHQCASVLPCQEILSEDGRTHAACAYPADTCTRADAESAECRDNVRIQCDHGLIINKYDCGNLTCTPIDAPTGEHVATCALARPGCASKAEWVHECQGDVSVACTYGVPALSTDCAASGEVCRPDFSSECWPADYGL